jgi:hypothetical protein
MGDGPADEAFPVNAGATRDRLASWLEQAWLTRYLDRKLNEEENAWFEAYMLDKPELIAAIEADSDLRDGVSLTGLEPARDPVTAPPPRRPTLARRQNPRWLAWAASAALGIGIGWLVASQVATRPAQAPLEIVASPTRVVFDTLRGLEAPPVVYPGAPASGWLLIEFGLPADAEDIVLRFGSAGDALRLSSSTDGFATVLLPRRLAEQLDSLDLSFESGGQTSTRSFRLDPSRLPETPK